MTCLGIPIKPMLDDFAERAGVKIKTAWEDPRDTARELKKASAVMIPNVGIMCCGRTMEEAEELSFVVEKNSRAFLYAQLFGKHKPIRGGVAADLRKKFLAGNEKKDKK